MSQRAPRYARRIDTIVRRKGYYQRCEQKRMEIVRLFCAGKLLKQIAGMLDTREGNVSYAVANVMKENGLKTHAQLGVWARDNGYAEPVGSKNQSPRHPENAVVTSGNGSEVCNSLGHGSAA